MPCAPVPEECEVPVVEPGPHAEAGTARIEADEGHEDEVEPARADRVRGASSTDVTKRMRRARWLVMTG